MNVLTLSLHNMILLVQSCVRSFCVPCSEDKCATVCEYVMQIPDHFRSLTIKYATDERKRKRFSAPPPSPPVRANAWLYDRDTAFVAVAALYSVSGSVQCNQCGLRVPEETIVAHKQAHFDLNRALKKQTARPWEQTLDEFVSSQEQQTETEGQQQPLSRMVQDSRHSLELCFVCMLGMNLPEWDVELDEWYVPNCLEHSSGQRIHATCSAELAPDKKYQEMLQNNGDSAAAAAAVSTATAAVVYTDHSSSADPATAAAAATFLSENTAPVHPGTSGGTGGGLSLACIIQSFSEQEKEGQIRLLTERDRSRRGHGHKSLYGKSTATISSGCTRDSTGRRGTMDPVAAAIEQLLNKSDLPSSVTAVLTVSREHLVEVYKNLEGAHWAESSPTWIQSVTYTVPAHPEDVVQTPVLLNYVEDGDVRSYREQILQQVQLRASNESGVQVQVRNTRHTKARPPNSRTRYTQIEVKNYRMFVKGSSSAPGILWCFTATVHWKSDSIRGAQLASPEHTLSVALTRDYSARGGRGPDESPAARAWMAQNLLAKLKQVCLSDLRI